MIVWLYSEPFGPETGPKFQAHLSPFSAPLASYHAFSCGSVIASLCSWLVTLIVGSASELFGYWCSSQFVGYVELTVYGMLA